MSPSIAEQMSLDEQAILRKLRVFFHASVLPTGRVRDNLLENALERVMKDVDTSSALCNANERDIKEYIKAGMYSSRTNGQQRKEHSLPLPMYAGLHILDTHRDFVPPYNIFTCKGEGVPTGWRAIRRNAYVGCYNKRALLPRPKCFCYSGIGCQENCINRAMMYECDDVSCNMLSCSNRAFQRLTAAENAGNSFRIGVEVRWTGDRGYGLFAMRAYAPQEIVCEYRGEVITQEECERRLQGDAKSTNFYFLDFDNGLLLDGLRKGSLARYANHSCSPNCNIEKWIVEGEPRIGLFAGKRGIGVGEEITYDYKFAWFEGAAEQKCCCGARNCSGMIGRKPLPSRLGRFVRERNVGRKGNAFSGNVEKLSHMSGSQTNAVKRAARKRPKFRNVATRTSQRLMI